MYLRAKLRTSMDGNWPLPQHFSSKFDLRIIQWPRRPDISLYSVDRFMYLKEVAPSGHFAVILWF